MDAIGLGRLVGLRMVCIGFCLGLVSGWFRAGLGWISGFGLA